MMGRDGAQALTVAGCAQFVAGEMASVACNPARRAMVAAECVGPLLNAAMIAMQLAGLTRQQNSAAVHDVLADYLNSPPPAVIDVRGVRVDENEREGTVA